MLYRVACTPQPKSHGHLKQKYSLSHGVIWEVALGTVGKTNDATGD